MAHQPLRFEQQVGTSKVDVGVRNMLHERIEALVVELGLTEQVEAGMRWPAHQALPGETHDEGQAEAMRLMREEWVIEVRPRREWR